MIFWIGFSTFQVILALGEFAAIHNPYPLFYVKSDIPSAPIIDKIIVIECMQMTKLTFYGGVNEIGGNKILLEDKKTRVLFDFGQSFAFGFLLIC